MKIGVKLDTAASDAMLDLFKTLNVKMTKKIARRAVNLSTRPLLAKAKQKLKNPVTQGDETGPQKITGQLLRSMGRTVKTYPSGVSVGMANRFSTTPQRLPTWLSLATAGRIPRRLTRSSVRRSMNRYLRFSRS